MKKNRKNVLFVARMGPVFVALVVLLAVALCFSACHPMSGSSGLYPTFTVFLKPDGASGGTISIQVTLGKPMPPVVKPVKAGYTFAGYYLDQKGEEFQYYDANANGVKNWDLAHDAVLYAAWI